MDITHSIDAKGKPCPIPLIMLKKKMAKINKGELVEVIADSFVTKENIERFGRERYEFIGIDEDDGVFKIYIKK